MNSSNSNDFVMKSPFLLHPGRERSLSSTWVAFSLVMNGMSRDREIKGNREGVENDPFF